VLDSEDDLQRALYSLHKSTKAFGMKISPLKPKVMAFRGQVSVRVKIVIETNPILEEVNTFTYMECISHMKRWT
jgi:hypothetical protein